MTTKVTVDAHAGWPVRVEEFDPTGEYTGMTIVNTVEPGTTMDFYIHSSAALLIEELSHPTEEVQDAQPE